MRVLRVVDLLPFLLQLRSRTHFGIIFLVWNECIDIYFLTKKNLDRFPFLWPAFRGESNVSSVFMASLGVFLVFAVHF